MHPSTAHVTAAIMEKHGFSLKTPVSEMGATWDPGCARFSFLVGPEVRNFLFCLPSPITALKWPYPNFAQASVTIVSRIRPYSRTSRSSEDGRSDDLIIQRLCPIRGSAEPRFSEGAHPGLRVGKRRGVTTPSVTYRLCRICAMCMARDWNSRGLVSM